MVNSPSSGQAPLAAQEASLNRVVWPRNSWCPRHTARTHPTKRDRAALPGQNMFSWVRVWCFPVHSLGFASPHEVPTQLHQGQCWRLKQCALVTTHIHVLALPNSLLSISTVWDIYYHRQPKMLQTTFIHTSHPKIMTKEQHPLFSF